MSALSGNSTIWFVLVPTGLQLAQKIFWTFFTTNLLKIMLFILVTFLNLSGNFTIGIFLVPTGPPQLAQKTSELFFFYPYFSGWATQQASVYHGQTHDLPRQSIGKGFHQEKEQMVSPLNNFGNAPHWLRFFLFWHEILILQNYVNFIGLDNRFDSNKIFDSIIWILSACKY